MSHLKKSFLACFIILCLFSNFYAIPSISATTKSGYSFVVLSCYKTTVNIGEDFYIVAVTSTGKKASWKSSSSSIASVNTYGKVTPKKNGTAVITAKITNGEASCKVTVRKTAITLNTKSVTLEHNATKKLTASTSNDSEVTFKSSKKSIASVDDSGKITANKPGETTITVKADTTEASVKVTVKKPTITLSKASVSLFRNQTASLRAKVSSNITPTWKSNKKSVATVDENGQITAVKHGNAVISATVDGVTKQCEVTVKSPTIKLSKSELSLKAGQSATITATVSSGNTPEWSTSNSNVVSVSNGVIKTWKKGNAYIYASEDGTKERVIVHVTD